jgi:hypothetical protein
MRDRDCVSALAFDLSFWGGDALSGHFLTRPFPISRVEAGHFAAKQGFCGAGDLFL